MYGQAIEDAIMGLIWFCAIVGFLLGGLVFWLGPKIWHWIIPLIHQWTA